MRTVQFDVSDDKVIEALDALRPFAISKVRIFEEKPRPISPARDAEQDALARRIADAIAPKAGQSARRSALSLVLGGGDTFSAQEGAADPGIRNAIGAISKKLRRFDPYADSPLELLCERRREVFSKGEAKGVYKGIRYGPNRLGERVLRVLKERGAL